MRTTFIIPDELYARVKKQAVDERRTATSIVEEALTRYLLKTGGIAPFYFKEMGEGGLRPGVDLTNGASVQDILDDEYYAEERVPEAVAA